MQPGLRSGKLIRWKDDRGFGFIQPADGSPEVFLHISEIKDATRRPNVQDIIYYHLMTDSDGKIRAQNAFILGARNTSKSLSPKLKLASLNSSKFPIAEVVLLSLLPIAGAVNFAWKMRHPLLFLLPFLLYLVMSVLTYVLYADDKSRAQRNDWRTSEQTLHFCEFAGGWLGGFIAQRILRHKSQKQSYQVVFWAIVTLHYIAWLLWLFWGRALK